MRCGFIFRSFVAIIGVTGDHERDGRGGSWTRDDVLVDLLLLFYAARPDTQVAVTHLRLAAVFDYGGVMTTSVRKSFRLYEREEGLPPNTMGRLLADGYVADGPIADVEIGRQQPGVLDQYFRNRLYAEGLAVSDRPIHERLFAAVGVEPRMWRYVCDLRSRGVITGLLTNSWGTSLYDMDSIRRHFDVTVISCETGLRKPDAAIFEETGRLLAVPLDACVYVDDMEINVKAARDSGMRPVLHTSVEATTAAVSARLQHLTASRFEP